MGWLIRSSTFYHDIFGFRSPWGPENIKKKEMVMGWFRFMTASSVKRRGDPGINKRQLLKRRYETVGMAELK